MKSVHRLGYLYATHSIQILEETKTNTNAHMLLKVYNNSSPQGS